MKRFLCVLLTAALLAGSLTLSVAAAAKPCITQVEAGHYSLAVTSNGDLYGWGGNTFGLVSPGEAGPILTPVKIMSDVKMVAVPTSSNLCNTTSALTDSTAKLSTGHFMMIVKTDGKLYVIGDNSTGQHGTGQQYGYLETRKMSEWDTNTLHYVMDDVVKVACNGTACAAITENGDLYFWGYQFAAAESGGQAIPVSYHLEPEVILNDVKDVELGFDHMVILQKDGSVLTMGCQDRGTLGNGKSLSGKGSLRKDLTLIFENCKDIAAGRHSTYMVTETGDLYVCGDNGQAKLGFPFETQQVLRPTKVKSGVLEVEAATNNACYITTDGSLWTMGDNNWYQRGYYQRSGGWIGEHTKVTDNVTAVSMGTYYTMLLKEDGKMYGFGDGRYLGTGTKDYPNPMGAGYMDTPYVWEPVPAGISAGIYAGMFGSAFKDVKTGAYYYEPVLWAVEREITSGTGADTFSPDLTCSRAQIITFLWRAAGCPDPRGANPYSDVKDTDYYAKAAVWAGEEGMVLLGGRFNPDAPCSRLMAVEFMWKAAGRPEAATVNFSDVASPAVNWAVAQGVTNGTGATTFSPDLTCTRGQIVTFLYRAR